MKNMKQTHAGKYRGHDVWHSDDDGKTWWSGSCFPTTQRSRATNFSKWRVCIRCDPKHTARIVNALRLIGAVIAADHVYTSQWLLLLADKDGVLVQGSSSPWIGCNMTTINLCNEMGVSQHKECI